MLDVRGRGEYDGRAAPRAIRGRGTSRARGTSTSALLARCETVEQVQEVVGLPAGAEIVAYCHCGSRSALAVQILRAAGYEARNYAGSWHEWSRREDLPSRLEAAPPRPPGRGGTLAGGRSRRLFVR